MPLDITPLASIGLRPARLLAAASAIVLSACGSSSAEPPARPLTVSNSLVQPIGTYEGRAQVAVNDYGDPVIAFAGNANSDYGYVTGTYQMQAALLDMQAPTGVARSPVPTAPIHAHAAPPRDALTALDAIGTLEKDLLQQTGPTTMTRSLALRGFTTKAAADTIGQQRVFWAIAGGRFVEVNATCQAVGGNVYVYVDNDARTLPPDPATLMALVQTWDAQIYPRVRAHFGSEWSPGIDNDPMITVLISPAVHNYSNDGTLGYFWAGDEFTAQEAAQYRCGAEPCRSNEREMLYATDLLAAVPQAKIYGILAHEFQHMVNFHQRLILNGVDEDDWLNEGLSMLAMQLAGFGMPDGDPTTTEWVDFFLSNPSFYGMNGRTYPNSLVLWNGANYGQDYLFLLYLYEQYGGDLLLQQLMTSRYRGILNVEVALGRPFASVYNDWLAALYLDGRTQDRKYNFASVDLQGTYTGEVASGVYGPVTLPGLQTTKVSALPGSYSGNPLPPWTAEFIEFNGNAQPATLNLLLDNYDSSLGPHLINLRYR